ncbi:MAG: hypothetical protein ACKO2V_12600, partial [Snowella sp.]
SGLKAIYKIYPNYNLRRARRRFRQLQRDYAQGVISLDDLVQRIQSWEAHLLKAHTDGLRRSIFNYWAFSKNDR